jgi:hypothetical protein
MSNFKWAHGDNANLKEPIPALKEKGWQYADVPTASNFNWLFNKIQKELEAVNSEFQSLKESINAEIKAIKDNAASIKKTAEAALGKSNANERAVEFGIGVSRQICDLLRLLEKNIKAYHPNFPNQPWPLTNEAVSNNEGELN